ncbi:MAG: hypothetical protein LBS44_04340 [Deltaproteobacteria bacterium]|nr:hypothetical protein [Deltaproteobacteria bacterium]
MLSFLMLSFLMLSFLMLSLLSHPALVDGSGRDLHRQMGGQWFSPPYY